MKSTLFVANWKMQKSYDEARQFFTNFKTELYTLAESSQAEIILCPSFVSLPDTQSFFVQSSVHYGAQDCSAHEHGAYTGEVSAQSLAELGCRYCIVGHSERRQYHQEDDPLITQKITRLLEHGVTPIVCIGESFNEYQSGQTLDVLRHQLTSALSISSDTQQKHHTVCIAYEPLWAIGTGLIPQKHELTTIFEYLYSYCVQQHFSFPSIRLLYGGSVAPANCIEVASTNRVDGFLIGSASLDFQTLQNIVSLVVSNKK